MIERATAADIPELCRLLAILFSQEAEFSPDSGKQAAALARILADPACGQILVLREDEKIHAMVSLLFTVSTAMGGKAAWLEDLVVDPRMRGRGHGARLLRAAVAHARNEGCLRISLLTDGDNLKAIEFYRRRGFSMSGMTPLRLIL